jgi:hypothetical protein
MARSTPRRRALSIQQIFLLLGSLNGIVLATLLVSSWQLLKDSGSATGHASITLFLGGLLVINLAISSVIVSQRVIRPLRRLVRESHAIAVDEGTDGGLPPVLRTNR